MHFIKKVLVLSVFFGACSAVAKTVWLDETQFRPKENTAINTSELAEGDAESVPVDFSLTQEEMEFSTAAATAPVEKETVEDEKIPTLTAEGGFLLPTYVLPEAKEVKEAERSVPVDQKNPWRESAISEAKASSDQPTAPVKLSKPTASVKKPALPTKTVVVEGAQGMENPENKKESQLLQSLNEQYQNTNELLNSATQKLEALERERENIKRAQAIQQAEAEKKKNRGPLLLPLPEKRKVPEPIEEEEEPYQAPRNVNERGYVDHVLSVLEKKETEPTYYTASDDLVLKSIPTELKISFLPGTADLSAQSLKWIKAFAYHPKKAVNNIVEIRLSPNELELQSRRFALIKGALEGAGLNARQIRFVLTDRNPDTIVLRSIALPEDSEVLYQKGKDGKMASQIIQKW